MTAVPQSAVPGVQTVDSTLAGRSGHPIPIRDYLPVAAAPVRPFLWVHGGGFMNGGLDQKESDAVARTIAATGRHVRTVDYRLVPMVNFRGQLHLKPSDNRFPAPLHDVLDVYLDLVRISPDVRPVIGGASAGACLTLAASTELRDEAGPLPAGIILLYGTFHGHPAPVSDELRSRLRLRDRLLAVLIGSDALERMNQNYGGSVESLDDHRVFPGGGDLRGLPATYLLNADRDGLRASGDALAQELTSSRVTTESITLRDSAHGFLDKPTTAAFEQGTEGMISWLNELDGAAP